MRYVSITAVTVAFSISAANGQTAIYVDDDAPLGGNGASWDTAYKYLQDALVAAASGSQIRVAAGVYMPDQAEAGSVTPGNREATFRLLNGIALYGGYAGLANPNDHNAHDIDVYETVLSGDLNGDDWSYFGRNDENAFRVVTAFAVDDTAILNGVTIEGGNANDPSFGFNIGGGMYNSQGDPTLTNCTFRANTATYRGGGMYIAAGNPTLTSCTFTGNLVETDGGGMYNTGSPTLTDCTFNGNEAGYGGGIYSYTGAPTLISCRFSGNTATYRGGGVWTSSSFWVSPTLTNCTFTGNSAEYGGGLYTWSGDPTLINCVFTANTATRDGGGMHNYQGHAILTNCTFSANTATRSGGGMGGDGMVGYGDAWLRNCVLWGNSVNGAHDESAQIGSRADVWAQYTCIEGWTGFGTANIGRDPLFGDPNGADNVFGTLDDDLRLSSSSSCIDAGQNAAVPPDTVDIDGDGDTNEPTPLDLDGSPRFLDDPLVTDHGSGDPPIVDMGAYEYADCNGNEIPDRDDINSGTSQDCNVNAIPDECDLTQGTSDDCNANAALDDCDIANGTSMDCNGNGVPDDCDLIEGTSDDCDANAVPDECQGDDDGDGVINTCDHCPDTPTGLILGDHGCAVPYGPCCFTVGPCIDNTNGADCALVGGSYWGDGLTCYGDPDWDWTSGCDDGCPLDPNKVVPGICGCGVPDVDADGDSVVDCLDACPNTQQGLPTNSCGCPALGACCFVVGVCWDDVEPAECTTIGATYQGDGSICKNGCGFGDFDDSREVDLRDFAYFQNCFSGPDRGPVDASCHRGDIDSCGTIDLLDYAAFHARLTG